MEEKGRKERGAYLVFEAGGYPLAVEISQIGKVYFKGEAIPEGEVLNLGEILGKKQNDGKYYLEILVRGEKLLVKVDKIEPIKDLQLAVWLDFPKPMRRESNKMIKGFFFDGSRMISLIDFESISARGSK